MGLDIAKPAFEQSSHNFGINRQVSSQWNPNKSYMTTFRGKDDTYGCPPEGSKTAARAKRAREHMNKELSNLLIIIRNIGQRNAQSNEITVTFGRLFEYYEPISDKIVGLLLRARRWNLVDFPGEMLYQRQDENVLIRLTECVSNPQSGGDSPSAVKPDATQSHDTHDTQYKQKRATKRQVLTSSTAHSNKPMVNGNKPMVNGTNGDTQYEQKGVNTSKKVCSLSLMMGSAGTGR